MEEETKRKSIDEIINEMSQRSERDESPSSLERSGAVKGSKNRSRSGEEYSDRDADEGGEWQTGGGAGEGQGRPSVGNVGEGQGQQTGGDAGEGQEDQEDRPKGNLYGLALHKTFEEIVKLEKRQMKQILIARRTEDISDGEAVEVPDVAFEGNATEDVESDTVLRSEEKATIRRNEPLYQKELPRILLQAAIEGLKQEGLTKQQCTQLCIAENTAEELWKLPVFPTNRAKTGLPAVDENKSDPSETVRKPDGPTEYSSREEDSSLAGNSSPTGNSSGEEHNAPIDNSSPTEFSSQAEYLADHLKDDLTGRVKDFLHDNDIQEEILNSQAIYTEVPFAVELTAERRREILSEAGITPVNQEPATVAGMSVKVPMLSGMGGIPANQEPVPVAGMSLKVPMPSGMGDTPVASGVNSEEDENIPVYEHGIMDLVLQKSDGRFTIWDYKSDGKGSEEREQFEENLEYKYKPQLAMYQEALRQAIEFKRQCGGEQNEKDIKIETKLYHLYRNS